MIVKPAVRSIYEEKPAGSACTHIGSLWHYTDGEASTCKKEGWELDVYICKGTENEGAKDERVCGKVFLTEEAAKSDDFATVLHKVEDKEELQNLTTFRKSLPLAGHTPVTDGAVEATCSEKGLTEGSHCGVCGTILKAQKETDAIEHSFTDTVTFESQPAVNVEICSMCGISREGVSYIFSLNENKDGYILEKVGNLLSVGSMEVPCRHNGKPVTDIGENCAVNAWWLEEITIPNGIKTIGGGAFGNSQSLKKVNIPDSITDVSSNAFYSCIRLKCREYGNAYYIGSSANPYLVLINAKDTAITSCNIHEDTKVIQDYAFYGCNSLKSITIPAGVKNIGNMAFALGDITFNGTKAQWKEMSKGGLWNSNTGNYTVSCKDGKLDKNGDETDV